MTIQHVSFTTVIEVGGELASITSYSRNKHGEHIDLIEKGPYLILKMRKMPGVQFRVPISSVGHIKETEDVEPAVKK